MHSFIVGLLENIGLADGEKAMKQRDTQRFNDATVASFTARAASRRKTLAFLQSNVAESLRRLSEVLLIWSIVSFHGTTGGVPWKENLIRVMLFAMLFSARECSVTSRSISICWGSVCANVVWMSVQLWRYREGAILNGFTQQEKRLDSNGPYIFAIRALNIRALYDEDCS